MEKQEILNGMKMARTLADERYVLRSEYNSDTSASSSVTTITIGDTEPTDGSIWFDTSPYASIQGATPNMSFTVTPKIYVGDTQPTNGEIWIDTSED